MTTDQPTATDDERRVAAHARAKDTLINRMAPSVRGFTTQSLRDQALGALMLAFAADEPMETMAATIIGLGDGLTEVGRP